VARIASSEWGTERGMELAGERFAVLGSEAASESMLASLPTRTETGASGQPGSRDRDPASRPVSEPGQDSSDGQPNNSSAPVREGASLNVGPFV